MLGDQVFDAADTYFAVSENTLGDSGRTYTIWGTVLADFVGVRGVSDAFSKHDAVDGHQQSTGERWMDGIFGSVSLVGTAFGIGGLATKATGIGGKAVANTVDDAARGAARQADDVAEKWRNIKPDNVCFMAGDQVIVGPPIAAEPAAQAVAAWGLADYIVVAMGGVALVLWEAGRRQERKMTERAKADPRGNKQRSDQIWSEGFEPLVVDEDEDLLCAIAEGRSDSVAAQVAIPASQESPWSCEWPREKAATSRKRSLHAARESSAKSPPKAHGLKRIALLCGLLAATLFGAASLSNRPTALDKTSDSVAASASWSAGAYRTANIEDVRVGQRVVAEISDADQIVESAETEVDARTWRLLRLRADVRWPDGTLDDVHVATLQPPEWVTTHAASLGNEVPIPLDLVEMGLPEELVARVVANEPCPAIASGPGRVVLTTVNHLNANIYRLTLQSPDGRQETVRPTAWHKFYCLTHGGWTSAQDLEPGDELDGLDEPLTVVSLERHPGTHRVYNMTVESEHVYFVSTLGALSHNNGCQHVDDPLQARSFDTGSRPRVPGTGQADTLGRGASPGELGRNGEAIAGQMSGAPKNTARYNVNGRDRIPDQVLSSSVTTKLPNHIAEVKNVKRQSLTKQLRDDVDLVGPGGRVDVYLPRNARVSRPLQRAFDDPLNPLRRRDL